MISLYGPKGKMEFLLHFFPFFRFFHFYILKISFCNLEIKKKSEKERVQKKKGLKTEKNQRKIDAQNARKGRVGELETTGHIILINLLLLNQSRLLCNELISHNICQ